MNIFSIKNLLSKFYLALICLAMCNVLFPASDAQSKIDSLRQIYEQQDIDSLRYKSLRLYEKAVRRSDRVAALPLMKERVRLAQMVDNSDWVIKSLLTLGNNFMYLSEPDSARIVLDEAVVLSRKIGVLNLLSAGLNSSATLYQRENDYEHAIEAYHEVIVISDSLGDYVNQLVGYGNLSVILMEQGNYERALEHLLKTEDLYTDLLKKKDDSLAEFESFLTATFQNIAMCYSELGNIDLASSYFEKAKSFIPKIKDAYSSTYYSAFIKHGIVSIEIDKCIDRGNCNRTRWNELLEEAQESLNGFLEIEYERGIAMSLLDIGKVLNGIGDYRSAKDTLANVLNLSLQLNYKELVKDCYRALSDNAESLGSFRKANEYLKQWTLYRDSIRNEERDKFTQQKEIELETFQKENEILQLQVEAEAQSRRQAIQLFAFLILLISIIAGAYILYTRYKLKKEREIAAFERAVNQAMSRFVPMAFIRAIGREAITEVELGDQVEKEVTVVFTDIRDFTTISEGMEPAENFNFVKDYAARMGPIIEANGGFVNQYLGDGIMAIFERSPNDALNACIAMQKEIEDYNETLIAKGQKGIRVGMGMHTGPLIMGIIGDQIRRDATIISDTVNSASRIESTTKMYQHNILLSGASYDRLEGQGQYDLVLMGDIMVKGKTRSVEVYACLYEN